MLLEAAIRTEVEPSLSSHWAERHSGFSFEGGKFAGIRGFGSITPRTLRHRIAHRLMQGPLRRTMAHLGAFSPILRSGRDVARAQRRTLDLDFLRQIASLAVIQEFAQPKRHPTVLVIGDGFGAFSSTVLNYMPQSRVVLTNLDKTLLVDLMFIKMVFGNQFDAIVRLISSPAEMDEALHARGVRLIALRARDAGLVERVPIDWAVNIASMQEMLHADIHLYFSALRGVATRREVLFYNCNRVEKKHPDGTIIRFADYPWSRYDDFVLDELCPWHQEYYRFRPPGYLPYDGAHRHALVRIAPSVQA